MPCIQVKTNVKTDAKAAENKGSGTGNQLFSG